LSEFVNDFDAPYTRLPVGILSVIPTGDVLQEEMASSSI